MLAHGGVSLSAGAQVPVIVELVEQKWKKFARGHYVLYSVFPYALFAVIATAAIQQRSFQAHPLRSGPRVPSAL